MLPHFLNEEEVTPAPLTNRHWPLPYQIFDVTCFTQVDQFHLAVYFTRKVQAAQSIDKARINNMLQILTANYKKDFCIQDVLNQILSLHVGLSHYT